LGRGGTTDGFTLEVTEIVEVAEGAARKLGAKF